jgi:GNAT superfamily N-acetyltransferase
MRVRDEELIGFAHRLSTDPSLRPVVPDEVARFSRYELAATVEGAFGELSDPDQMSSVEEQRWHERLPNHRFSHEDRFSDRYWLIGEHGIAGTLGVSRFLVGMESVRLESLYITPANRNAGLATRALETAYRAAVAEGLGGIRLDTYWTWQRAVRYYLARRLWVWSWKHSLGFLRHPNLPRYDIRADRGAHTLLIEHDGTMAPLLVAGRDGTRLLLDPTDLHRELEADETNSDITFHGRSTLALRLAVDGWPLVRSLEDWERAPQHSDIGAPEGLAYKIQVFERVAREGGWRVDTPHIPGLGDEGWDPVRP